MNRLHNHGDITLPMVETNTTPEQKKIYDTFMGHMRRVPISRPEIKILSAIQFTADLMDGSDAHIAKELVDMGLRAPRMAFPFEFLDYTDNALMRCGWDIGAPSKAMIDLRDQWYGSRSEQMGFSAFRHVHTILQEEVIRH